MNVDIDYKLKHVLNYSTLQKTSTMAFIKYSFRRKKQRRQNTHDRNEKKTEGNQRERNERRTVTPHNHKTDAIATSVIGPHKTAVARWLQSASSIQKSINLEEKKQLKSINTNSRKKTTN
ncbi:hypothetical protein L1887_23179 [Cichorium endivia]|nr:hypothetical protein L1887_23179 [Cichorium endivia]